MRSSSARLFRGQVVPTAWITVLALAGAAALAQGEPGVQRQAAGQLWSQQRCAEGVELRLTSAEPTQGSLLVVELSSAKHLAEVVGTWNGNEIPFWHVADAGQQAHDGSRALVGIDLGQAAGEYPLVVAAKTAEGASLTCQANLTVKRGRFATEKLNLAPQFVKPDAEQLARAEQESKHVRELLASVTPDKLWDGPFRMPLAGATRGGNFGKQRVLNGQPSSPHAGVDFPAAAGTPVHAAQRGRVVLAEPLYFSGNTVIVDHGLGVYTFYGHLLSFGVGAGDVVEAGALLGKVGSTGRATGPHLHWALTVNGARVNPLDIVRLRTLLTTSPGSSRPGR